LLTLHAETHQAVGSRSLTDTKINTCQVGSQKHFQLYTYVCCGWA